MKHHAVQMYDYHVWANRNVFARLKEVAPELYKQQIQSVFPSISAAVAHMYTTDDLWLQVMRQLSYNDFVPMLMERREEAMAANLDRMEKLNAGLEKQYDQFFAQHPDLDVPAGGEHPMFGKLETTLAEMVYHVVNHGTYHRGHVTAMLRQLGVPGAASDYVMFLYTLKA